MCNDPKCWICAMIKGRMEQEDPFLQALLARAVGVVQRPTLQWRLGPDGPLEDMNPMFPPGPVDEKERPGNQ